MTDDDRITEVSATVDAGMSQEALDAMPEAERLALIVGAAYGAALAERDEARAEVAALTASLIDMCAKAARVVNLDALQVLTFAHDEDAVSALRAAIQGNGPVDSEQTPTQED